jgi:hypothetical protein
MTLKCSGEEATHVRFEVVSSIPYMPNIFWPGIWRTSRDRQVDAGQIGVFANVLQPLSKKNYV